MTEMNLNDHIVSQVTLLTNINTQSNIGSDLIPSTSQNYLQ